MDESIGRERCVTPNQDGVGVPRDVDRHDMGKDVSHGRGERIDEPEVGAGATGVDDRDTAGPQVSGDVLKELA